MRLTEVLIVCILAAQGFLLLRPDGVLVHAAQPAGRRRTDATAQWWRKSIVHMGCSMPECTRPATRTASYHQWTARGGMWRAYGFCEFHNPPEDSAGLVYRLGRPPSSGYDVALGPVWTPVYFLLGALGFGVWCGGMWKYGRSPGSGPLRLCFFLVQVAVVAALWQI